jgi:cytochrome c oxidase cbb3-type subunit IV
MFKSILENSELMQNLGLIALILFFVIFMIILFWAFKLDKRFVNKMKSLPLEENKINQ